MKKMILLLAVLLIASPAWATVAIDCTTDGNEVTVTYDADNEPNLPRAFALNISLSDGAIIETLVPGSFKIGESTSGSKGFGIFPGSIEIDNEGVVTDDGGPVAPSDDPCTVGQVGDSAITVEMASLYVGPQGKGQANAPDSNGVLLKFTVDKSTTVTIAKNARRGGVVKENPDENANDTYSGCTVTIAPPLCMGDMDNNGWITTNDVQVLMGLLIATAPNYYYQDSTPPSGADMDNNGWITTNDVQVLMGNLIATSPNYYYQCP